jgi:hypothetical protein
VANTITNLSEIFKQMSGVELQTLMKEPQLNPHVIEYFKANESQLTETFYQGEGRGWSLYSLHTPDGTIPFTETDFRWWSNNREYYESPLYKVMYEEK